MPGLLFYMESFTSWVTDSEDTQKSDRDTGNADLREDRRNKASD